MSECVNKVVIRTLKTQIRLRALPPFFPLIAWTQLTIMSAKAAAVRRLAVASRGASEPAPEENNPLEKDTPKFHHQTLRFELLSCQRSWLSEWTRLLDAQRADEAFLALLARRGAALNRLETSSDERPTTVASKLEIVKQHEARRAMVSKVQTMEATANYSLDSGPGSSFSSADKARAFLELVKESAELQGAKLGVHSGTLRECLQRLSIDAIDAIAPMFSADARYQADTNGWPESAHYLWLQAQASHLHDSAVAQLLSDMAQKGNVDPAPINSDETEAADDAVEPSRRKRPKLSYSAAEVKEHSTWWREHTNRQRAAAALKRDNERKLEDWKRGFIDRCLEEAQRLQRQSEAQQRAITSESSCAERQAHSELVRQHKERIALSTRQLSSDLDEAAVHLNAAVKVLSQLEAQALRFKLKAYAAEQAAAEAELIIIRAEAQRVDAEARAQSVAANRAKTAARAERKNEEKAARAALLAQQ